MSCFIIAEAGVNHNGDIKLAKQLVDAAVQAGADAVKFQTFKAGNLVTKEAQQANYQTQNTGVEESQYDMLKRLELSDEHHKELIEYCAQFDIEFMSTAFDSQSIQLLHRLGMTRWKIPSGELLSIPYLREIASYNQDTILSTGMGSLDEVEIAVKTLVNAGLSAEKLTILQANTAYPTPYEDVNLKAMLTLAKKFHTSVGLSDHSLGIEVPIAAVAMGAEVIEKHFTLDRNMSGPDHKASLEPQELKQMVRAIRHVELALGSGIKTASASEKANKSVARKRIVAGKNIEQGQVFTKDNLEIKRASSGIYAQYWDDLIGKVAPKNYLAGEVIDE